VDEKKAERVKRIGKIIGYLAEATERFGGPPSEAATEVYDKLLADIPIELVAKAANDFIYDPTRTRFPTPAEFRERCVHVINPYITAESAWLTVMVTLKEGTKEIPEFFSEPTVDGIMACGGWHTMRQAQDIFRLNRLFCATYNSSADNIRRKQCTKEGIKPLLEAADKAGLLTNGSEAKKNSGD
jgi:hypothetical protein